MNLENANPELRAKLRRIPSVPFHNPLIRKLVEKLILLVPEFKGDDQIQVDYVKHDNINSKFYRPSHAPSGAAMLWIHGGGYLFGHPKQDDLLCRQFASVLGLTIVSVNYRHAPAHPFPAALDDCYSAWHWLVQNASRLKIDPRRIAIGGQSAGGGLAAALVQRIHDFRGLQPAAQILLCPMLDDRTATDTSLDSKRHFIWNNKNNRAAWRCYLGQQAGLTTTPEYAVPARRENLQDLPPCWIGVGAIDLFHKESLNYAQHLKDYGVDCELYVAEGAPHAFESIFFNSRLAKNYWQANLDFLQKTLNIKKPR